MMYLRRLMGAGTQITGDNYSLAVMSDYLMRYWPCDGDGTNELVEGDTLTVQGTAGAQGLTGQGEAVSLSTGESVIGSNISNLSLPLSIEFMLKSALDGTVTLMTNSGAGDYRGVLLLVYDTGEIELRVGRSGNTASQYRRNWKSPSGVVLADVPTHIVVRIAGYNDVELIVDGSPVTLTYSSGTSTSVTFGTQGVFEVKADTVSSVVVDVIALYGYNLTLEQVASHALIAGVLNA